MNYPSIGIEGAVLPPDILERLEGAAGQQSAGQTRPKPVATTRGVRTPAVATMFNHGPPAENDSRYQASLVCIYGNYDSSAYTTATRNSECLDTNETAGEARRRP